MAISTTQAASAIAALMRKAISNRDTSRTLLAPTSATAKSGPTRRTGDKKAEEKKTSRDLASFIEGRIASLDPDSPQFTHRALRMLIEAGLLEEFGHELINAPRFQTVVDLVTRELESSELMSVDIRTIMADLRAHLGHNDGDGKPTNRPHRT